MATSFPLPTMPLEWHKTENWLERYEFYIQSAKLTDTKKATFLANCGQDAYELIKGLLLPTKLSDAEVVFDNPKDNETSIVAKLTEHLKPKQILHYERYKFFCCRQKQLSIYEFVADLRNLTSTCEFSTIQDALLLTQFIIGVDNSKLREKFLTKVDLNFTQSIQEALLNEESYNASTAIATPTINDNDLKLTSSTAHPTMESSSHSVCALTKHYTSNARPGWKRDAPKNIPNQGACKSCGEAHSRATCKFRNAMLQLPTCGTHSVGLRV